MSSPEVGDTLVVMHDEFPIIKINHDGIHIAVGETKDAKNKPIIIVEKKHITTHFSHRTGLFMVKISYIETVKGYIEEALPKG